MTTQDQGQMPITKVYESVGRLYLQLVDADTSLRQLVSQVASLTEQNQALQATLNSRVKTSELPK
jgi:hypothetical protein